MEGMKLYIVRHGETDWNRERKLQGHSDIPLNAYGRYLARQTAEGMKDVGIDRVYTSPLIRARETAEIILAGRRVPVIEADEIMEVGFGIYEGLSCAGEGEEAGSETFLKFFRDPSNYVPGEGGETIEALLERTGTFLRRLCNDKSLSEERILLSTHGAAMTALLNHIRGNLEPADFWKEDVPANCAVTTVEVKNGIPVIVEENKVYYKEAVRRWDKE